MKPSTEDGIEYFVYGILVGMVLTSIFFIWTMPGALL